MDKISKKQIMVLFLCLFFVFLASGCATQKPIPSGFLAEYPSFEQDDNEKEGLYFDDNPDKKTGQYSKLIIEPVVIYWHPEAKGKEVNPEELKELSDYFRQELITALKDSYSIVNKPGKKVLRIRIAITDVEPNIPLLNIHWTTTLAGLGIGGASKEVEFVDSLTGERFDYVIGSQEGKRYKKLKGLTRWGHTKDILRQWAQLIRERLDSHKGR